MRNGLHMIAVLAAFAVLMSLVSGNDCDCHVCNAVSTEITTHGFPIDSIGGEQTFSDSGIVDGSAFTLGNIVWIEAGTNQFRGLSAAFYSNNLNLSASPAHIQVGDLPPSNSPTSVTLPPSVQSAITNGCFCPHAGMEIFLQDQTLGTFELNYITNSTGSEPLNFACGAGTSETTFQVNALATTWTSSASGFSASVGFGHVGTTSGQVRTDAALFGGICSQCPTPEPTPSPTESPTKFPTPFPTDAPTESPTPFPTGSPSKAPSIAPDESDPAFFEVQNNIYMVAGAGGGFLLLVLLLVLVRSRRKTKSTQVLSALPADVEDPETKPRKARGNAPDPNNSQSIRLEIDDEIFDWEKHIDKASGEVYFFNPKTGESRWEPPTIKKKT